MHLNQQHSEVAEQRRKKRERLEANAVGTIRSYLRDELTAIAPADWTPEMLDELEEAKMAESQRIIDALSASELEDEFNMQRHGERAVAELRMEVHRRISESRTNTNNVELKLPLDTL